MQEREQEWNVGSEVNAEREKTKPKEGEGSTYEDLLLLWNAFLAPSNFCALNMSDFYDISSN